jgi:hypothetical protein
LCKVLYREMARDIPESFFLGGGISFLGWQMKGRKERSFDRLCTLIVPVIGLGGAAWVPLFPVRLGIFLCTAFSTPRSFPSPLICGP